MMKIRKDITTSRPTDEIYKDETTGFLVKIRDHGDNKQDLRNDHFSIKIQGSIVDDSGKAVLRQGMLDDHDADHYLVFRGFSRSYNLDSLPDNFEFDGELEKMKKTAFDFCLKRYGQLKKMNKI
jgi:hypothetical protein